MSPRTRFFRRTVSTLSTFFFFIASNAGAGLKVDDCEDPEGRNALGGSWVSYVAPGSTASPVPFRFSTGGRSGACARLDYELRAGSPYPYAGFNSNFSSRDFSAYEGVRFYAKGTGSWLCQVILPSTEKEYNHYSSSLSLSKDWMLVEVPFKDLTQAWGTPQPKDLAAVTGVQFNASAPPGEKGFLCVDDLEFYKKDEARIKPPEANVILTEPKVNQVGYLRNSTKMFTVSICEGGAKAGGSFRVVDEAEKTAFQGRLEKEAVDDVSSTGERVLRGDFTALSMPGRYHVEVAGRSSPSFEIRDDVFRKLFSDALHCFKVIRCGTQVDDPATGVKHAACHMADAPFVEGPTQKRDLTGGWHNAGDFGKWVMEEAISCSWMMWAHEMRTAEGLPDRPDLLTEARWGLEWMLKMQEKDGSVRHKVDSEQNFCFGTPPEKDPQTTHRRAGRPSSVDTGDFVGVMAQASRVYLGSDKAFADRCALAAKRAWGWLEKNPRVVETDFAYTDLDPSQEAQWALGEMARLTGDEALSARARNNVGAPLRQVAWMEPQFFGQMARLFDPQSSEGDREAIRHSLGVLADDLVRRSTSSGYGVVTSESEYWWESNENLLARAGALLFAHASLKDEKYRIAAQMQIDWLLGRNSLAFSFVTGMGERCVKKPYHWVHATYGLAMPGWASGGPNRYPKGADPRLLAVQNRGTPPAKCYVDDNGAQGSWASNEGETSENAALVFVSGMLDVEPAQ